MAQLKDTTVQGNINVTDIVYANNLSLRGEQQQKLVLATPSSASGAPAFRQLTLADISNTTPISVTNGGTGTTAAPVAGGIIYGVSTTKYGCTTTGTAGQVLISQGTSAPIWYKGLSTTGTTTATYATIFHHTVGVGVAPAMSDYAITLIDGIKIMGSSTSAAGYLVVEGASTGKYAISLYPEDDKYGSLGLTNHRWGHLYIGSSQSYGDKYTPIYWNSSGLPEAIKQVVSVPFTINSGKKGVTLTATGVFTADSYVSEIVVDSGMQYLNAPLIWTTSANTVKIETSIATSNTVTGYIHVIRGGTVTITSTDIV